MSSLNISVIQANFTVGAIKANLKKITELYQQINSAAKIDIIIFSELSITGYPADDLYLQKNFQQQVALALEKLQRITKNNDCALIVGSIDGSRNVAYVIADGKILHTTIKRNLPNYGVFDEQRYFIPANTSRIFNWKGHAIGVLICEDMWSEEISKEICEQGAKILIAVNASPFNLTKDQKRKEIAQKICRAHKVDLLYVNQVGGQDELVFDGGSFAFNKYGEQIAQLEYFKEDQATINLNQTAKLAPVPSKIEAIYKASMLGLSDYLCKNAFDKVILGLSGGIDSALVAAIAVDALGKDRVVAVTLPSQYTSALSNYDARALADELGIELIDLPIEAVVNAARLSLSALMKLSPASIADQNIQARTRGLLLMAIANQLGYLLLSTGNKSENAVGYATLYGDMCGSYNPIKDIYKTQVYQLASYRNLPKSIIEKAPSAELHFSQKDQDTLPDYELLDQILYNLIEEDLGIAEIVSKGYDANLVGNIFKMLKGSEYKRRQACPGPIVSIRPLSRDRRYPMTNKFDNN